jgi:mono/diheme cytochrome c family protein
VETEALVEHGGTIYAVAGCANCHGALGDEPTLEGAPSLEIFVSRFGLHDQADLDTAVDLLASGRLHDPELASAPPFEGYEEVGLAARIYEELIQGDGHDNVFVELGLHEPMPQWGAVLSDHDIEALMAYLLVIGSR